MAERHEQPDEMMHQNKRRPQAKPSEEGFLLVAVIFLLFLLAISLTIAAPRMAKQIQRDRDLETMERGKQYVRAIQLYYRKFHSYPPSVDALVKTNNIRFLRKRYIDPITGKDDWKPILFGQNKLPTAYGFFGQPKAGAGGAIAGIGPSGGNMQQNNGLGTSTGTGFGSSGNSGFGSSFGGSFGSSSSGFGSSSGGGSLFGSSDSGSTASTSTASGSSGTSGGTGTGSGDSTGSGSSGTGSGTSSFGSGQTFGGAGIIGFRPGSTKESILVYKKKNHYNEWEFVYDPLNDVRQMGGNSGLMGQPASGQSNQNGSTGFGGSSFGGSSFGGSSFGGSSGGFGSSTTTQQPNNQQ